MITLINDDYNPTEMMASFFLKKKSVEEVLAKHNTLPHTKCVCLFVLFVSWPN